MVYNRLFYFNPLVDDCLFKIKNNVITRLITKNDLKGDFEWLYYLCENMNLRKIF